jgi:hypothetical protein
MKQDRVLQCPTQSYPIQTMTAVTTRKPHLRMEEPATQAENQAASDWVGVVREYRSFGSIPTAKN